MVEKALALARELGADLAGWASLDRGELELYSLLKPIEADRFQSALVVAKAHDSSVLANPHALPTKAYNRDYRQLNSELGELAKEIEAHLRRDGIHCLAIMPSETLDKKRQRGMVSHRALAQRAGLGVRGRNNLLVTPLFQSRVRLASVLTDLQVPRVPELIVPYPCVQCNKCWEACPAEALGENPSDFRLDRCLAHLETIQTSEMSPQICGICLAICPGLDAVQDS
jgi:epoxyqueuosine reductase QueG